MLCVICDYPSLLFPSRSSSPFIPPVLEWTDEFFLVIFIPCVSLSSFSSSFFPFLPSVRYLLSFLLSLYLTYYAFSLHLLPLFPFSLLLCSVIHPSVLLFPCNPPITLLGCFSSMLYSFQLCSSFLPPLLFFCYLPSLQYFLSLCVSICLLKCLNVLCTCMFEQFSCCRDFAVCTCSCMICVCTCARVCVLSGGSKHCT